MTAIPPTGNKICFSGKASEREKPEAMRDALQRAFNGYIGAAPPETPKNADDTDAKQLLRDALQRSLDWRG